MLFGDTQHDEKREERYALMLQRKEADGLIFLGHRLPKNSGRRWSGRGAGVCAGRQRLRVQSAAAHPERAHRQRRGRVRGDGPSLRARPSPDRHRHRSARQPAQPRSSARRDDARAGRSGPSRNSSSCTATSRSSRARSPAERLLARRAADRDVLLQRRNGHGRRSSARAATRCACPQDLSIVGFDDIRFCRAHGPAADDDRAADARDRRGHRAAAARHSQRQDPCPLSVTLPHRLIVRASTA